MGTALTEQKLITTKKANSPGKKSNAAGHYYDDTIYNSYGDKIQVIGYFLPNDKYDIHYEYEYDLNGNWIKRNNFYPNSGKREVYQRRTITYY